MQRPKPKTVTLNDILITEELFKRSPRPPNLQAENQAMRSLARRMARDSQTLLQTLVETALELCQAETAGVSLLETTSDGEEIFRWTVLAGTLAHHVGGTSPRNFSPCGVCLDRGTPVLFSHPERYFTYFQAANTPVVEGLVLPLIADDHVLGTIWIMSHDQDRHFDAEDVRTMTSLADFTATALLLNQRQTGELLAANATLEAEVAERKQIETQLSETQRRLELSLIGADLGTWTYRISTDEFWADDRALQMHGHEPDEVHTFAQAGAHIHPEDRDRAQATLARVIQDRSKLQMEYRVIWRDGSVHWIASYAEFVLTGEQDQGMFYGVVQDITEAKRVQFDRDQSEARLQVMIENLPGGAVFVVDRDLRYVLAEGEALSIAGFKPDDLVGKTVSEAVPPELVANYEGLYRRALSGESFEQEHNAHDRTYVSRGKPLRSADGEVYAVLAVSYDISDRKEAEVSLRESETKYRSLFNSIDEGYALCELIYDATGKAIDWRLLEVNPAFERLTGFVDAAGKTATELNQNLGSAWIETFNNVAETGEPARFEIHAESVDYWFDLYASRLDGDSRHLVVVFNNVTERKRAEAALVADLEDTKLLHDLSTRFVTEDDIQAIYQEIVATAIALTRADAGTVQILDEATQDLVLLATQGFERNVTDHFHRVNASSNTSCGMALATGDRTFIDFDVPQSEDQSEDADGSMRMHVEAGYLSAQSTPLIARSGKRIGMVSTHWRKHHRPSDRELRFLDLLARQAADLIEQRQAEAALRESEEKYRSLFENVNDGFCIIEMLYGDGQPIDHRFLEANPAFEAQSGLAQAIGKTTRDFAPNLEVEILTNYERVLTTGEPIEFEIHSADLNQYFRVSAYRHGDPQTKQLALVFNNITVAKRVEDERKRREANLAFLAQIAEDSSRLASEEAIMKSTGERLATHLRLDGFNFSYVDERHESVTIKYSWNAADVPQLLGTFRFAEYMTEESTRTMRAGETWVVCDTQHDERTDAQATAAIGVAAVIIVPYHRRGEWQGCLTVTCREVREWTADEIALIVEVSNRTFPRLERARAEEDLRESEVKYRLLFNSISEGYALCELLYDDDERAINWKILQVNPAFESLTGLRDVAGKTATQLNQSLNQNWLKTFETVAQTGESTRFEHYIDSVDYWFEILVSRINEDKHHIVVVFNNITDRKQAEADQIRLIQEQAARQQERQRAESLAELDRAKTLFFTNISHEFRTPLTLMLAPLQDALKSVDEWMSGSVDDPSSTHLPIHPSTLKQNLELAHRNSLRLLKLVNTLLDFSRIEAGRMEAVYEPTDLAQFTTELASVFRSTIEQAGLRLIVDCPPLPQAVFVDREMWEKIVLNLLSNAFKFTFAGEITVTLRSELGADSQNLTGEPQSLAGEPQNLASKSQTLAGESQNLTSKPQNLTAEAQNLTAEAQTLAPEAQAFTSESQTSAAELKTLGSESETAILVPQRLTSQPHVILEIRDTGTGIAPEYLPHLFERFYQVRGTQARTYEGSGIGLALVYELVQLQGGTINVSSTLGEGTCFTIVLPFGTEHLPSVHLVSPQENRLRRGEAERIQPIRTLASTAMGAAAYGLEAERWLPEESERVGEWESGKVEDRLSPHPPISPSPHRVLVVDDNADMRDYLTRILSKQVQVEAVADGTAALLATQARVPDLVLADIMMPGLDGFQLLQALRADPQTREVPIILLSARAGDEAIVEGLDAGADDYLIKPFSAQELVSRVNAHLQMAQLRGKALQAARTNIRRQNEVISTVSHELNTPLVSILGWTRLLRANPFSSTMLTKALDTIERNATLQAKLVQDLLDISRITAGKLRLNPQPIELQSVLETAIATVTRTAIDKGIHLTYQGNVTNPVLVMGDSDRLQQVMCNLLTNAIKFTPASGSVTLELSVDASYAQIRVTDTGIGITADFLPHVFERFRQAEGVNAAKGLGLGLAIARHIVELHNGTIHAESAGEGQGATFIVKLPLLRN